MLAVLTSHATHASGKPTGLWLPELTHFYDICKKAGIEIDFVSPLGGETPIDPASNKRPDVISRACLSDAVFRQKLQHTKKPSEVAAQEYVAIYYPGGHGPMWDLAQNADIAQLSAKIYEQGGVVSAVCHGPAGLLPVMLSDGTALLSGKHVTGFSNAEEHLSGKTEEVPFLLEDKLRADAKNYTKAFFPFSAHVVVDERLITGQNPKSAKEVAQAVLTALSHSALIQ